MLRADPPPVAGREVRDISAVIHDPDAKTQPGDEPGPASTRITSSSRALTPSVSHARVAPLELGEQDPPAAYGVCK
jgi:hypothetical protein